MKRKIKNKRMRGKGRWVNSRKSGTEMTKFMLETANSTMTLKFKPVIWRLNLSSCPSTRDIKRKVFLRKILGIQIRFQIEKQHREMRGFSFVSHKSH